METGGTYPTSIFYVCVIKYTEVIREGSPSKCPTYEYYTFEKQSKNELFLAAQAHVAIYFCWNAFTQLTLHKCILIYFMQNAWKVKVLGLDLLQQQAASFWMLII